MNSRGQLYTIVTVAFVCLLVFLLIAVVLIPIINRPSGSPSPSQGYQEIHVERIYQNETWVKLQAYCLEHADVMLMLKVQYWDSPEQNKLVRARYGQLAELGNPLGLKVNIAIDAEINTVPYEDQYRVIRFGRDYLAGLGITVTHFAPGWWSFNMDTVQACKDVGFTHFHVWHKQAQPLENIEVVAVENYVHDWEL